MRIAWWRVRARLPDAEGNGHPSERFGDYDITPPTDGGCETIYDQEEGLQHIMHSVTHPLGSVHDTPLDFVLQILREAQLEATDENPARRPTFDPVRADPTP